MLGLLQIVQQLLQRFIVITGPLERALLLADGLQQLGQRRLVIAGKIVGAIVGQQDPLGVLVGAFHPDNRDGCGPALESGLGSMVAGENDVLLPPRYNGAVKAVGLDGLANGSYVSLAGILWMRHQAGNGHRRIVAAVDDIHIQKIALDAPVIPRSSRLAFSFLIASCLICATRASLAFRIAAVSLSVMPRK